MLYFIWLQSIVWNPAVPLFPVLPSVFKGRLKRDGTCAENRFRLSWNGRVHLNRRGRQFSRLLAAELCASAVVLSYPRTHIFHDHNAIIACLTQLLMNFDGFHATQVEESDNHALSFECKRRHFQYLKHYWHSTTLHACNG